MLVKNVTQTVKVPVSFLMKDLNLLSPEAKELLLVAARAQAKGDKEGYLTGFDQIAADARAVLSEAQLKELDDMGCLLPSDLLALTMTLGDFLYHVYVIHTKKPESPLGIKRLEKRLMDLAAAFSADEFEVQEDVIKTVSDVLSDDKKWSTTQFGATFKKGEDARYLGLTTHGAKIFTEIVSAAVGLCIENEGAA